VRRRDFIQAIASTGATWPLAVYAQHSARPVVGFLHFGSPGPFEYQVAAFNQGLKETGFVDGQNAAIEYRWADGRYDRQPALTTDLISRKADVITAIGPPCASAAKRATSTIPAGIAQAGLDVRDDPKRTSTHPDRTPSRTAMRVDTMSCPKVEAKTFRC